MKKGFSLIELMVAISIFAVIGVLTTSAVSLTLRTSKKSDSLVRVRENVSYAFSIIERQIRGADSIENCDGSELSVLNYLTSENIITDFSCENIGEAGYIASGSARITSSDVAVVSCSFVCTQTDSNSPPTVKVKISAQDAIATSEEKGTITTETEIVARNY